MKWMQKIPRPASIAIISTFVVIFALTSYVVGSRSLKSQGNSGSDQNCQYTQEELNSIIEKYNQPDPDRSDFLDNGVGMPPPVDAAAIEGLEGECADVALDQAYDLGMRQLRDLTDCWDSCTITDDYSSTRLNFAIKNRRMVHMGAY